MFYEEKGAFHPIKELLASFIIHLPPHLIQKISDFREILVQVIKAVNAVDA